MSHRVLFVCLGNICRSPTAEGVFRYKVEQAGLQNMFTIDSAGTSAWHIGEAPDPRSCEAALDRGYDLSALRGRQVSEADFEKFDYIFAMDKANLRDLKAMAPGEFAGTLDLFLNFPTPQSTIEVPDPYHGGARGFEQVLDLIEAASDAIIQHIQTQPRP